MDPLVDNDTQGLHWKLSPDDSKRLLAALFPDDKLFQLKSVELLPTTSPISSPEMACILARLRDGGHYGKKEEEEENAKSKDTREKKATKKKDSGCWVYGPSAIKSEYEMANFLNDTMDAVEGAIGGKFLNRQWVISLFQQPVLIRIIRKWVADGANTPLQGSDANRKPDLVLIPAHVASALKPLDWRDVSAVGEMKICKSSSTMRSSYIEVAGKTALLLYAQDGRHSAPSLRFLGNHIILTFFDRGGSLSTAPIDINQNPEDFLRILIGLSCAPLCHIGFDETVITHADGKKRVLVAWTGNLVGSEVIMDHVLFISDALHGRGTTIWTALMHSDPQKAPRRIVVKDSWIDPLRKFTEGGILAQLNKAGVKGVPKLIHEQQVQGPHPSLPDFKVNQSTHFLRALLSPTKFHHYHVRVLSHLLTEPLGQRIFGFSSLAELLVAFIDYVLSKSLCILHFYLLTPYSVHKDAILKANVLHRDMSLLNFLLVLWNRSDTEYSWDFVRSSHLSPEAQESLLRKLEGVSHQGHLADWGYAVPYCPNNAFNFPLHNDMNTKVTTPERNTELPDVVQSANLEAASSPLTSLSTLEVPTSPIADDSDENAIPIRHLGSSESPYYVPISGLKHMHDITLSMGGDVTNPCRPSVDTNPLYRTVSPMKFQWLLVI